MLLRLERERCSGEVSCGMEGRVLLSDGLVCRAESRRATPLAALWTPDGPVGEQPWWPGQGGTPEDAAGGAGDASPLQVYALTATFDAMALLLDTARSAAWPGRPDGGPADRGGGPGFEPVFVAGRLGRRTVRCKGVPPTVLLHECARLADRAGGWPLALADAAPVVALRHVHRQRVMLTAVQAEVSLAVDGRRTPAGLAAELGRPVVVCLEAVRALTALGLVERPVVGVGGPLRRRTRPAAGPVRPPQEPPVDLETLMRLRAALEQV
ncbi:hypothetical protein [Actinomadura oligospora]|uniref:hypothetical protein n=1 Tax=Actinomadura oligospora TaxID=111804 RepID=UPI0012FCDAFE|nr:hypothetical protein [Actinomadura oligospora]